MRLMSLYRLVPFKLDFIKAIFGLLVKGLDSVLYCYDRIESWLLVPNKGIHFRAMLVLHYISIIMTG